MARLFFAIWPDEPSAAALEALATSVAATTLGKPVPRAKIHLTLAFLGDVPESGTNGVLQAAAGLEGRSFAAVFDRIGTFRQARVAWTGMSAPPRELLELQRRLAGRLRDAGFAIEDRPFTPHITLARRIERAMRPEARTPIGWAARELTLVRSDTGKGSYSVTERWALS